MEYLETLSLHDETDVAVIGGGIMGTMAALEMAERGLGVEVFDKLPKGATSDNTSYAAGAEFLPFVFGENPTLHAPGVKERLPFQISYLLCTLQGFGESRQYYTPLANIPDSGFTQLPLVEPIHPTQPWERFLQELMDPDRKLLWQPRYLESGEGGHTKYSEYYLCETFAIQPTLALPYLRKRFLAHPRAAWHYGSHVTKAALNTCKNRPIVVAAGHEVDDIHKTTVFPRHIRQGMSASFRTNEQLTLPMISFDDLVVAPHADRFGFNAGGLDIANYGGDKEKAKEALIRRVRELGRTAIGPWQGLPASVLENYNPEFRTGARLMGMFGMRVEQDSFEPRIVSIEDAGSIGWTLAPYAGRLAADFVCEIVDDVKQGKPNNQLLIADGENIFVPRTLMRDIEMRPSEDVRNWRDGDLDYRKLMRTITHLALNEAEAALQRYKSSHGVS